jgi:hypothetical protein
MHKLTLSLVTALALAGIGQAHAAPAQDACAALMEARGHLVNMLAATDKAVLDDLNGKVQAASGKLDGILNAMERGYNAADAQRATEFKPVWGEFKNTRETGIIPALYAGKAADAKALATGIQAERMKKLKGAMGCQ